ncbi:MAG: carbon-nitrogen hydrolase family protein [Longimicrobiales bacterium]
MSPRRSSSPSPSPSEARVAVVQAAPRPFDREAAIARVAGLTAEAGAKGAKLILFPEAYVPAYPWGLMFGTRIGGRTETGRRMFEAYWEAAVELPGTAGTAAGAGGRAGAGEPSSRTRDSGAFNALSAAARDAEAYLAVGVVERDVEFSGGTLYCTLAYFGPDGAFLGKHRKLKPTAAERVVWGEGDGSTLPVIETPFGRVGGLICWENYMPLARMAMYGKGVQFWLAPTADARDTWQATLRHIACEGRCFVLGCNQYVRRDDYAADLPGREELEDAPDVLCRGGSAIIGPLGDVLAGPLHGEEGILYADLELGALPRAKFDFDVTGHYARADVFRLSVNEARALPVSSPRALGRGAQPDRDADADPGAPAQAMARAKGTTT